MTAFKQIKDFPGYKVYSDGKVWSYRRGKFLAANLDKNGYKRVQLYCEGRFKTIRIRRLLLETFVGPCPGGMEGLHKNDIKADNRLENLYWGTHSQNIREAFKNSKRTNTKLTVSKVKEIKKHLTENSSFNSRRKLARQYNVSKDVVRKIWTNKSFAWID